jgi:surface antigen
MSARLFSVRLFLIPALSGALLVSACQNNGNGSSGGMNKENIGTVLGGIGGAVLGAQFGSGTGRLVGVAAGALAGAYLGNQIGSSLDKADRAEMEKASTRATTAPIGQPVSWRNPDSGNSGTVTPTREGTASNGDYCREFQQSVTVGGKTEQAYGTACRQPDGSWKVING